MAQCTNNSLDLLANSGSLKRKRNTSDDKDDEDYEPPVKQTMLVERCSHGSSEIDHIEDSSPLYISSDDDLIDFASIRRKDCFIDQFYSDDNELTPQYDEEYNYKNLFASPSKLKSDRRFSFKRRKCPLPPLSWANHCDVWHKMCEKDAEANTETSHNVFQKHPGLQMRMRAILLDWIIEVCEVYKLHRETFHLTVNYIDRYLFATQDVYKGRLQLIGITCLFIAAKVEEIYPPKIAEFAYVTDGACTKEDILSEEIVILQTLHWKTTPNTINRWLNAYMQLLTLQEMQQESPNKDNMNEEDLKRYTFIFPQYSSLQYVICGQLIDLVMLHVGMNAFPYSLVAAAAIAHIYDKEIAMKVSSYTWDDLLPCYEWLTPFAVVVENDGDGLRSVGNTLPDCGADYTASSGGLARICPNINLDQSHRIQVHNICLEQFDKAQEYMEALKRRCIESTPTTSGSKGCMPPIPPITPPYSDQKDDGERILETKTPVQISRDK